MTRRHKPRGATRATTRLDRLGAEFAVREYTHDASNQSYGAGAVEALDIAPDRVFKTLIASLDETLVVAVLPVPSSLDLKALARSLGGRKATMAAPPDAERATGYVVGGISPIGQRRQHRTVVDESAARHETILVSGGRRGLDIELAPDVLITVTSATLAGITRIERP